MEPRREDLRRIADWLARRRAVDQAVAALTHYGPAASERIHSHLAALRHLLALEEQAPVVSQLPLPDGLSERDDRVVSLAERVRRGADLPG